MYKTPGEAVATAKALKVKLVNVDDVDVVVCPSFTGLVSVQEIVRESNIKLGGQNLHWEDEGAFTGEVSAGMLLDAGCEYVVIGHSERRHVFGETDDEINKKVLKALSSGLKPIFCIGEKLAQRNEGQTEKVIREQVSNGLQDVSISNPNDFIVAYEPVWAIGTGLNATPDQAEEVHKFTRGLLRELFGPEVAHQIRIQYGGSVKPANAEELLGQENIDGALVGGASLDPDSFTAIIKSAQQLSH